MRELLGGKGANLAEMASIGLPVPPGFTITTEVCSHFYSHDQSYPEALSNEVDKSSQAFDDDPNESNLNKLIAKAEAYDQFLLTKPDVVFARLREAHGALAAKL